MSDLNAQCRGDVVDKFEVVSLEGRDYCGEGDGTIDTEGHNGRHRYPECLPYKTATCTDPAKCGARHPHIYFPPAFDWESQHMMRLGFSSQSVTSVDDCGSSLPFEEIVNNWLMENPRHVLTHLLPDYPVTAEVEEYVAEVGMEIPEYRQLLSSCNMEETLVDSGPESDNEDLDRHLVAEHTRPLKKRRVEQPGSEMENQDSDKVLTGDNDCSPDKGSTDGDLQQTQQVTHENKRRTPSPEDRPKCGSEQRREIRLKKRGERDSKLQKVMEKCMERHLLHEQKRDKKYDEYERKREEREAEYERIRQEERRRMLDLEEQRLTFEREQQELNRRHEMHMFNMFFQFIHREQMQHITIQTHRQNTCLHLHLRHSMQLPHHTHSHQHLLHHTSKEIQSDIWHSHHLHRMTIFLVTVSYLILLI
ncbi:hepatoma-derived growth factor-related protein 2-like isoform X2 [Ptychodera flava]|uniref:hepatoma-derived growth factor-related protein 2-like isoform X2 n=1 Tax=Ptychodera flava TaxID=63121 RepID=UPI00396A11EB